MNEDVIKVWKEQFGLEPVAYSIENLLEYIKNTPNPHKHRNEDLAAIKGSIKTSGYKVPPLLWKNPRTGLIEVVIGCGRILSAADEGYSVLPAHRDDSMTEGQVKALRLADNRAKDLSNTYDDDLIIQTLRELKCENIDYSYLRYNNYDPIIDANYAKDNGIISQSETNSHLVTPDQSSVNPENVDDESQDELISRYDIPDQLYPSSNDWGIPDLLTNNQPTGLPQPVNRWGTQARTKRVDGQTIHFYTDDYRFEGIWRDPSKIVNSGCIALAEPNFSTNDNMPRAFVLFNIYKKRWISRFCQDFGIKIWIDLAIAPRHRDLSLLGVPKGYRAYATYTYTRDYDFDWVYKDFEQAKQHAGVDVDGGLLFWIYGGDDEVERIARENKWSWTPAHQQAYFRNVKK